MRLLILPLLLAGAVLAQQSAPAPTSAELARAGTAALNKAQFTTAVYYLKQAVALDPKHPSAWRDLGRAYLALDQIDAAIEAHRKQIDVHPECPEAYNNLGLAFWQKGKRDEAISAFRQQIELNPLEAAAHGNLGRLYYELERYPEAVREFEKAVAVDSENTDYRMALGGAYLGAGQTEKGLAILNGAVQDMPSPHIWNNVAYRLALHKVQLERAQQYAESAVTTTEAQLRNIEVDHVTVASLRLVVILANYWDTLGWVHFQRGNFDEAEKFLKAAWLLSQSGAVGDHLGHLYERRGQNQEAIQAFARALAGSRPLPNTWHRLQALTSEDQIEPLVRRAANELVAERTFKSGKRLEEKAAAEFYVASAPLPALPEASFIRGDEKLRPFVRAVQESVSPGIFPDSAPTRLLRRGTLTCPGGGGECVTMLFTAADAVTAELNSIPPDTHFLTQLSVKPGAGVFRMGGGVTAPTVLYKAEPEYTEEARRAKYQGSVMLYVEVDPSGLPRNIRVIRSLGLGLDEKAIEAVQKWQFRPGMKDGHPVTVAATVEVNFRLLKDAPSHR